MYIPCLYIPCSISHLLQPVLRFRTPVVKEIVKKVMQEKLDGQAITPILLLHHIKLPIPSTFFPP